MTASGRPGGQSMKVQIKFPLERMKTSEIMKAIYELRGCGFRSTAKELKKRAIEERAIARV